MSDQPHVILLMADHLRRDCLSCYGDLGVATPHLDALAAESVVFDGAYCACPLCVPTRISMYTGKWPHTHGAIVNGHSYEAERPYGTAGPEHRTLYEALDAAGYGITHVGVHHCRLDPPLEERVPAIDLVAYKEWGDYRKARGLRSNPATRAQHVPNLEWADGKPVMALRPQARRTLYPHPAEDYLDCFWTRLAVERIAELDAGRPQYVEVLLWAPHPPLEVPEPYYSMYPPESIELPETVGRWCEGQPASLLLQSCGQMGLGLTREEYREGWSAYLGLVTMVDDCMGRVVEALKARGMWDDALVIFTMDHGDLMGCHHLTQKHSFYEEAAHLPLLAKPPGGATGRRHQLTSAIDFCPTVCDYAGAEPPDGVQGMSWRPLVEGRESPWRDAIFMEYSGDQGRNAWPMRSTVADVGGRRWKYNWTRGDTDELYDLDADPMEMHSLAASAEHQALRRQVRGCLAEWMRATGDFVELGEL